jgi:D-alanyl-lipoteichoic acid acyltransferase DltB (MBOAT superfamily)
MTLPAFDAEKLLNLFVYQVKEPLLFNSGLFLFLFLAFMLFYGLLQQHVVARITYITVFSIYFYYKSSGWYFLLMMAAAVAAHFIAIKIYKTRQHQIRKFLLISSLVLFLGLLAYFKYTNFLIDIINNFSSKKIPFQTIFLPLGISFYTFELISYTVDVFKRKFKPVKHLLDFSFYISFFPHLVAGPIVRPNELVPQIRSKILIDKEHIGKGIFFILSGLIKKAIISDYIGINFVDRIFDNPALYSGVENLMGVYGYTLQIYCDFSGYSDMAVGIALLMGFHLPLNFDAPYQSTSITEFWRRWHISLSSWLRDYLYIPLGGNKSGKLRQYVNLMITMLLGGLWHGASFKFIVWGGMHGLALALDKAKMELLKKMKLNLSKHIIYKIGGWIFTFHLVAFCWIFFRASSFESALAILHQISSNFKPSLFLQLINGYQAVFFLMAVGYAIHFIPSHFELKIKKVITISPSFVQAFLLAFMIYLVYQTRSAEVQPFIYFQF